MKVDTENDIVEKHRNYLKRQNKDQHSSSKRPWLLVGVGGCLLLHLNVPMYCPSHCLAGLSPRTRWAADGVLGQPAEKSPIVGPRSRVQGILLGHGPAVGPRLRFTRGRSGLTVSIRRQRSRLPEAPGLCLLHLSLLPERRRQQCVS